MYKISNKRAYISILDSSFLQVGQPTHPPNRQVNQIVNSSLGIEMVLWIFGQKKI